MTAAITATRPRVDLMRGLAERLSSWPQFVVFDVGVPWAMFVDGAELRIGNALGLTGWADELDACGLQTEPLMLVQGWQVSARMRESALFPEDQKLHHFQLYEHVWQDEQRSWPLFGRQAIAAWLGIGEWDAGRVFWLHGDYTGRPQIEAVRARLDELIRMNGG